MQWHQHENYAKQALCKMDGWCYRRQLKDREWQDVIVHTVDICLAFCLYKNYGLQSIKENIRNTATSTRRRSLTNQLLWQQ